MKTYSAKPHEVEREWYVVDATDKPLGRLATEVATVLRGKHKPTYTPHVDTGDHVVVVNAARVRLTGDKINQKVRYRHSGYVGGLKAVPYSRLMAERPDFVVREAVRGMLPKTRLGRQMLKKLRVYRGAEHPHAAQNPKPLGEGA
ncbi:MAG: 50S ribosomal protein L13 [Actinobacteria bacterium]|nr:MAG: 50S ribosomal protein L13 [Actinomycetota bacterium]